jgi:molecular chaperone DnaK
MPTPIIGIDLGTSQSLVGVVEAGFPILLADDSGNRMTPSVVQWNPHSTSLIGKPAKNQRTLSPENTIYSVKRLIGRRPNEQPWTPPYNLNALGTSPQQISSLILAHLKSIAESQLQTQVQRAVITVPAYFNEGQRLITKRAAEEAGLEVVKLLSEPTAAALAYGFNQLENHQYITVYDLGGGTFDVSILQMREGVLEVLATAGDTALGGDDLDLLLAQYLYQKNIKNQKDNTTHTWENLSDQQKSKWLEIAENIKIQLSTTESYHLQLPFFDNQQHLDLQISRSEFEQLIKPLLYKTRTHLFKALADAQLQPADLHAILLVGGSTCIPLISQLIEEWTQILPNRSLHPDESVALGAVIQAGMIEGSIRQILLLDVTPLSLGIETYGGLMNIIIPRNSSLPCKAGELFTNAVSGQQEMLIRILQGEREMAKDNWELGLLKLPFTPAPKGSARVGVQFELDINGLLTVLVRDTLTQQEQIVKLENTIIDINNPEVEKMLAASVDYAIEDMQERIWNEEKLKAVELIDAIEQALTQVPEKTQLQVLAKTQHLTEQAAQLLNQGAHATAKLKSINQQLDQETQELAVILLEQALSFES